MDDLFRHRDRRCGLLSRYLRLPIAADRSQEISLLLKDCIPRLNRQLFQRQVLLTEVVGDFRPSCGGHGAEALPEIHEPW